MLKSDKPITRITRWCCCDKITKRMVESVISMVFACWIVSNHINNSNTFFKEPLIQESGGLDGLIEKPGST